MNHWAGLQTRIFALTLGLFVLIVSLSSYNFYAFTNRQIDGAITSKLTVAQNFYVSHLKALEQTLDIKLNHFLHSNLDYLADLQEGSSPSSENVITKFSNQNNVDFAWLLDSYKNVVAGENSILLTGIPVYKNKLKDSPQNFWIEFLNGDLILFRAKSIPSNDQISWILVGHKLSSTLLSQSTADSETDLMILVHSGETLEQVIGSSPYASYLENLNFRRFYAPEKVQKIQANNLPLYTSSLDLNNFGSYELSILAASEYQSEINFYQDLLTYTIPLIVFGLMVGVLGSFLIAKSINRPTAKLINDMQRIAKGDYKKLTPKGNVQDSAFVEPLMQMQEAIASRELKLKSRIEELVKSRIEEHKSKRNLNLRKIANANNAKQVRDFDNFYQTSLYPIDAIINLTSEIQNQPDAIDSARKAKAVRSWGTYLLHIFELVLMKTETIQHTKVEVNIFEFLEDIKTMIDGYTSTKGIEIELDFGMPLPKTAKFEWSLVKHILLTLCTTSLQNTTSSKITLQASYKKTKSLICFSIIESAAKDADGFYNSRMEKMGNALPRLGTNSGSKLSGIEQTAISLGGKIDIQTLKTKGSITSIQIPASVENDEWIENLQRDDLYRPFELSNEVQGFAAKTPSLLSDISEAYASEEWQELRKLCEKLAEIGYEEDLRTLTELAKDLEQAISSKDESEIWNSYEALFIEMSAIMENPKIASNDN